MCVSAKIGSSKDRIRFQSTTARNADHDRWPAIRCVRTDYRRYELEGDKLFALIQDVESRSFEESRTEAHSKFADVQIPLSASERYGFSLPQAGLALIEDRMEANDIAFYERPSREFFMDIDPGAYVVFLPNELHRPCLTITEKTPIRKAVIKVHRDLLGL